MSVTLEERAEWRRMLSSGLPIHAKCSEMLRLLDALEAVEAQRDVLLDIIAMTFCPEDEGQCGQRKESETMCHQCWKEWLNRMPKEQTHV